MTTDDTKTPDASPPGANHSIPLGIEPSSYDDSARLTLSATAPKIPASRHPVFVFLATQSPIGARNQQANLSWIARKLGSDFDAFPWTELEARHATIALAMMKRLELADATINQRLAALRGVMRQNYLLGHASLDEYVRFKEIKHRSKPTDGAGRYLKPHQIQQLIDTCLSDKDAVGIRDACIIALGYKLGVRRYEFSTMRREGLEGDQLTFSSKTMKRSVTLTDGEKALMQAWIKYRGDSVGPMFWGLKPGGRGRGHHAGLSKVGISEKSVARMFQRRCKQAGLERFAFHDLRRSLASNALTEGIDLSLVAKMGGWKGLTHLRKYDRRQEAATIAARSRLTINTEVLDE